MPTYDYECQACGHRFEKFQSMTARVLRKCPECQAPKLARLIGPGAGFLFKGDGFYITDYRSKSYQDGKKAAKSDAPGAADAKPAADARPAATTPAPKKGSDGS